MARQVSIYLAQKYTKMPASRIGRLVGGRDHSTVIYSCNQVEQRLKVDRKFSSEISSIENSFKIRNWEGQCPFLLSGFMRLNQNRPTLYNSNIKTIIQRQFLYFFLNKTIDTPYLTFSETRRNEMCS